MTSIEWTRGDDGSEGKTWNPLRGCSRVSPGCENCYAERTAIRHAGAGGAYEGLVRSTRNGPRWTGKVLTVPHKLDEPLRWRKPRRIFVNSMSDLFHEDVSNEFIAAVFGVMAACPQHTFQILTKRATRMREWFRWARYSYDGLHTIAKFFDEGTLRRIELIWTARNLCEVWPLPGVWLGVSVEDQQRANERIPILLDCPAAVWWVSAEPLLGPIYFGKSLGTQTLPLLTEDNVDAATGGGPLIDTTKIEERALFPGIDWVVVGGESGPGARPGDVRWMRALRDQCQEAGVPVFMKQMGSTIVLPGDEDLHGTGWGQYVVEEEAPDGEDRLIKFADRKGGDMDEWPRNLRVREYPNTNER